MLFIVSFSLYPSSKLFSIIIFINFSFLQYFLLNSFTSFSTTFISIIFSFFVCLKLRFINIVKFIHYGGYYMKVPFFDTKNKNSTFMVLFYIILLYLYLMLVLL
nr:MAG TPA: hypothetical protein [Caudoviricetes sp.]